MEETESVLIVDDSFINREMLSDMVNKYYPTDFAEDGEEAVKKIRENRNSYSLVLLDLNMPGLDGFGVLDWLNKEGIIGNLPVIVISSETAISLVENAYDKGADDYITRPFNERIVLRRIQNILALYSKKKNLENVLVDMFFTKEKDNQYMIDILANLIEFRNGETAEHIINVRKITSILLHALREEAPQYELNSEEVTLIVNGASLHDIGKISVPLSVLNKPGRFTSEEYEVMKKHSEAGARVLAESQGYETSNQIRVAHDICRWHHERFDGSGYPDGLSGDQIPIGAQVVALADVYDALTHERCYKASFTHEEAVRMILGGECGAFNPLLLQVLRNVAPLLKGGVDNSYLEKIESEDIGQTAQALLDRIGCA